MIRRYIFGQVHAVLQDVPEVLADKAALHISPDIDFGLHQLQNANSEAPPTANTSVHSGMSFQLPSFTISGIIATLVAVLTFKCISSS